MNYILLQQTLHRFDLYIQQNIETVCLNFSWVALEADLLVIHKRKWQC